MQEPVSLEEFSAWAAQYAQQLLHADETTRNARLAELRQQEPATADLVLAKMRLYGGGLDG